MDDYLRGFVAGYEAKAAASDPPTFPEANNRLREWQDAADEIYRPLGENPFFRTINKVVASDPLPGADYWRDGLNKLVSPTDVPSLFKLPRRKLSAAHKAAISRAAKARAKAKRAKAKGRA